MATVLAIETSTEACSAALLTDDKEIITRFQLAPREHTKLILPMMDEVLQEAGTELEEVDAIAFGRGPGAFTGLRIAAGVAQGVALSIDKPVIAISTLEALAYQTVEATPKINYQGETIIAALDARMNEVYWGVFQFENGKLNRVGDEQVSKAQDLLGAISETATLGTGSGWDVYQQDLYSVNPKPENLRILENQLPTAESIAHLAMQNYKQDKVTPVEDGQPVYIRNKVAEKSKKKN